MADNDNIIIRVSTQELQAASGQVNGSLQKMRNSFSVIEQAVERSAGYWQGEAAENHRKIYGDMKGTVEEILGRIQEHVEDLQAMARTYEEGEAAVQEMAADLPSDVII